MKKVNKICILTVFTVAIFFEGKGQALRGQPYDIVTIKKEVLLDKIKGGWAGQVIGCTYGGPTEFKWNGTMIDDNVPIPWDSTRMIWYFDNFPGLYDDVYMDLTFVDVFEKHGLDASDTLHARAIAQSKYQLWAANQNARYNILNGIMPPASGHWKNNPHADDIDFQIESDFAGLMSPGMVNSAVEICDKIGRIMNSGDGLYGGMFVAAMYSLAFVHDDIEYIVEKALEALPKESKYYQCIADVIKWYRQHPNDWKYAWFEVQKKWSHDIGSPDGVFAAYNIDAKINGAYIVIGLLYGKGDYGATIDISTRCGYDSDCNPANAGGILGTMIGYSNIPNYWKQGIDKIDDLNFAYTELSLNQVYDIGFKHASEMIMRNGGEENEDSFIIKYQAPKRVPLEINFEGLYPIDKRNLNSKLTAKDMEVTFDIMGSGFVLTGSAVNNNQNNQHAVLEADLYIDNAFIETIKMPTVYYARKYDVAWNYDLLEGKHNIKLITRNIPDHYQINVRDLVIYSRNEPDKQTHF